MNSNFRLLIGINLLWPALSMLFDGVNTLVLPARISEMVPEARQAGFLGALTFVGLASSVLVQPAAAMISDSRSELGRRWMIRFGVGLALPSLALFAILPGLPGLAAAYLLIQISAGIAQAGLQGYLPDLTPQRQRGLASGIRGMMDMSGATLAFVLLGALVGSGRFNLAIGIIAAVLAAGYFLTVRLVKEAAPRGDAHRPAGFTYAQKFFSAFRIGRFERAFSWMVLARFFFLLGTYAVGRFLLYYVADRMGASEAEAAKSAGALLGGLALLTLLASPIAGWASDRWGRVPLMLCGAALSALGVLLLISARSMAEIFLYGGLMAVGSACFSGANWAMTADLAPKGQGAHAYGLANIGTGAAAAFAGLFGILVDWGKAGGLVNAYSLLFAAAALVFGLSAIAAGCIGERRPSASAEEAV